MEPAADAAEGRDHRRVAVVLRAASGLVAERHRALQPLPSGLLYAAESGDLRTVEARRRSRPRQRQQRCHQPGRRRRQGPDRSPRTRSQVRPSLSPGCRLLRRARTAPVPYNRAAKTGPPNRPVDRLSEGHGPRPTLGVKARISAVVDVSFGLGLGLLAIANLDVFSFAQEVYMSNTNAVMACVWCGVAFLRGPGGRELQPKRKTQLRAEPESPRRTSEGSIPSPRTIPNLRRSRSAPGPRGNVGPVRGWPPLVSDRHAHETAVHRPTEPRRPPGTPWKARGSHLHGSPYRGGVLCRRPERPRQGTGQRRGVSDPTSCPRKRIRSCPRGRSRLRCLCLLLRGRSCRSRRCRGREW